MHSLWSYLWILNLYSLWVITRNLHCRAMRMCIPRHWQRFASSFCLKEGQTYTPPFPQTKGWGRDRCQSPGLLSTQEQHHQNHTCRLQYNATFRRNPSRNVACRAHTIFPPKYDLWPYTRRNTGGSITKNNRPVEFTMIHLHTKFERNPSRNAVDRAHKNVNQNMTFDPKRRNTGGSINSTRGVSIWLWCTSV